MAHGTRWRGATLVCAVLATPGGVEASGVDVPTEALVLGGVEATLLLGVTVTSIGNLLVAASGSRGSSGWPVVGYMFGGSNVVLGLSLIVLSAAGVGPRVELLGVLNLVLGGLGIGAAAWCMNQPLVPEGGSPTMAMAPWVWTDGDGTFTFGTTASF